MERQFDAIKEMGFDYVDLTDSHDGATLGTEYGFSASISLDSHPSKIRNMLKSTESTLDDFAIVDVNEAFAPQVMAVRQELDIDIEKFNVNGGALAVGHPLGASGARIMRPSTSSVT